MANLICTLSEIVALGRFRFEANERRGGISGSGDCGSRASLAIRDGRGDDIGMFYSE